MKMPARNAGFTLIELLITVTLVGIFAVLAIPSLTEMMATQRLRSTADNLHISALQARSIALRDNQLVMVRPVDDDTNWKKGWNVFIDTDRDNLLGTNTLVITPEALPDDIDVTKATGGGNNFFGYEGTGFLASIGGSANATWKISSTRTTKIRCLIIERTGRARVHDPFPATTCPSSS